MPTQDTKDVVYFELADGTQVSNDPRFDPDEMRLKMLEAKPNSGDVGIHAAEFEAQTQVVHPATMNSGQPGVGENAVPDDLIKEMHGPEGPVAHRIQKDDAALAREVGGDPYSTTVEDPEPVDSNEAVLEVRGEKEELRQAALDAAAGLDEEDVQGGDKPYEEWSGNQLKAEVARRNAERLNEQGNPIELKRGMKKSDVAKLLREDDAATAGPGDGPTGD